MTWIFKIIYVCVCIYHLIVNPKMNRLEAKYLKQVSPNKLLLDLKRI